MEFNESVTPKLLNGSVYIQNLNHIRCENMSLEETKSSQALKLLRQSRPPFRPTTATTGPSCPGGLQALGGGCQGNRALVCC